jgi:hypothetical protein
VNGGTVERDRDYGLKGASATRAIPVASLMFLLLAGVVFWRRAP